MDGLTALNTIGGEVVVGLADWAGATIIISLAAFLASGIAWLQSGGKVLGGLSSISLVVLLFLGFSNVGRTETVTPVRYEVTVNPGHVIDAARWETVEQRGEIYVIQERKNTEVGE